MYFYSNVVRPSGFSESGNMFYMWNTSVPLHSTIHTCCCMLKTCNVITTLHTHTHTGRLVTFKHVHTCAYPVWPLTLLRHQFKLLFICYGLQPAFRFHFQCNFDRSPNQNEKLLLMKWEWFIYVYGCTYIIL